MARVGRVASGIAEQARDAAQAVASTVADAAKSAVSVIPGIGGGSSS